MPYCKNCGGEVNQFESNCPTCGRELNINQQSQRIATQEDNGGFLWGLLGFCVPIAGLILFLVWNGERPKTAKACGLGALISVGAGILFYIIYFIFIILMISSGGVGY